MNTTDMLVVVTFFYLDIGGTIIQDMIMKKSVLKYKMIWKLNQFWSLKKKLKI